MSECITLVKGDYMCVIPKGATNGEVIKALFPNALVYEEMEECETLVHIVWDYKDDRNYSYIKKFWWNAPYKAESEE